MKNRGQPLHDATIVFRSEFFFAIKAGFTPLHITMVCYNMQRLLCRGNGRQNHPKEKILAASEAGITTLIFPGKNQGDLKAVSSEILETVRVKTANEITEVIDIILK